MADLSVLGEVPWGSVALAISAFSLGLGLWTNRRLLKTIRLVSEQAEVAIDMLDQMEKARDPGREVHDRLAHALEAGLIATRGPKVEPSERRSMAQLLAAQIIEDVRRAGLELVAPEPPLDAP